MGKGKKKNNQKKENPAPAADTPTRPPVEPSTSVMPVDIGVLKLDDTTPSQSVEQIKKSKKGKTKPMADVSSAAPTQPVPVVAAPNIEPDRPFKPHSEVPAISMDVPKSAPVEPELVPSQSKKGKKKTMKIRKLQQEQVCGDGQKVMLVHEPQDPPVKGQKPLTTVSLPHGFGDQQQYSSDPNQRAPGQRQGAPAPAAWGKKPESVGPRAAPDQRQGPPAQAAWGKKPESVEPRFAPDQRQGPPAPAAWGKKPEYGAYGGQPRSAAAGPVTSAPSQEVARQTSSKPPSPKGQQESGSQFSMPPIHIPNNYEVQVVANNPGRDGKLLQVYTNHFPMTTGSVKCIYQYDISITPAISKAVQRIIMEHVRVEQYPRHYPAYDGRKTLISPVQLFKNKEMEVTCEIKKNVAKHSNSLEDDIINHTNQMMSKSYTVAFKLVATLNIENFGGFYSRKPTKEVRVENSSVIHALELVMRHTMSVSNIPVGHSVFYKPKHDIILGSMYSLYRGIFQSINLGTSQAYLNVDVANKAFPIGGDMVELWKIYKNDYNRKQITPIDKWLKGLKILVKYTSNNQEVKRIYKCMGLGNTPANEMFLLEDDGQISVYDYFVRKKGVRLCFADLPCLMCRTPRHNVMIPMELCAVMPDQAMNKKLSGDETRDMIKKCATKANERMANIRQNIKEAAYHQDPVIRNFDLKVSSEPQKVNARILMPPVVLCGPTERDQEMPNRGAWRQNRLKVTACIREWSIIIVDVNCNERYIKDFIQMFVGKCKQMGISVGKQYPKVQRTETSRRKDIGDIFQSITNEDLVFVVIPDDNMVYSKVKTAAEILKGVLSQCIKLKTMLNMKPATISNLLLKVNAKLNGVNHDIKPRRPLPANTMFMGADVTHPSPDSIDTPSVAAVTACHDKSSFKYNIRFQMQAPGRELITNLDELVLAHLKFYKDANGTYPRSIIFYRDGVSNGQFKDVLNYEMTAIRKAYESLCKAKPLITFVVVQKRHHTRLFQANLNSEYNVEVGTCVDTEITNPNCQNFFLVSHTSFQGVVKPTKYVTLWDDHKFSNDDLESITYNMCHMFARCTKSVSYPAPTYYAHLAAARAKCYIHNVDFNPKDLYEKPEKYNVVLLDKIRKNLPMYFV